MLYNIMLVDDEAEVRQSILCQIPWEELAVKKQRGSAILKLLQVCDPDKRR